MSMHVRLLPLLLLLSSGLPALVGCGSLAATDGADPGRTLTGQFVFRPVPAYEQVSLFSDLDLTFVAYEALAGGNDLAKLSAAQPLPSAAFACAATGCSYQQQQVDLGPATKGAFALITPSSAAATAVLAPTATLVISPNQLLVNKATRTSFAANSQATVLSHAGVAAIANHAGLTEEQLMARGICLGTIASVRNGGSNALPGVAQARVSLVDAPAGASILYLDDTLLNVSANGTNAAGTFIVVGPSEPAADGAGMEIAVNVVADGSMLHWPSQAVVLRPQMVTVVPIFPYP